MTMRGVRKSRSPGDVGKAGRPKQALAEAHESLQTLLRQSPAAEHRKRARSAFEDIERSKLRPILLADQRHLCVYCEAEVVDDPENPPPVEHWEPVRAAPHRALHWENLYLSCRGSQSCDAKKSGHRLAWSDTDPSLPTPFEFDYERYVGFGRGGDIYVRQGSNLTAAQRRALELAIDDSTGGGAKRESILGLNHPDLVAARKAVIDRERSRIQKLFPSARADTNAPERRSRAKSLLDAARRESFVSVRVAWLEGHIGRDRP